MRVFADRFLDDAASDHERFRRLVDTVLRSVFGTDWVSQSGRQAVSQLVSQSVRQAGRQAVILLLFYYSIILFIDSSIHAFTHRLID